MSREAGILYPPIPLPSALSPPQSVSTAQCPAALSSLWEALHFSPTQRAQLVGFAVIPLLIVVGAYIPQYIKGKQATDQRIAASAKQVEIVKKALEPVCVSVHADNPNKSRDRSSYSVMGYLRDLDNTDCYVHVQLNDSGTITNISYVEGIDINKSLEENLQQAERDFTTLQKPFENLNVSPSSFRAS